MKPEEIAAAIVVRIKESSTAKPGTPPAIEVTATDQATGEGRRNAIDHAIAAYLETKEGLREVEHRLRIILNMEQADEV